jgi:hypothetical protein
MTEPAPETSRQTVVPRRWRICEVTNRHKVYERALIVLAKVQAIVRLLEEIEHLRTLVEEAEARAFTGQWRPGSEGRSFFVHAFVPLVRPAEGERANTRFDYIENAQLVTAPATVRLERLEALVTRDFATMWEPETRSLACHDTNKPKYGKGPSLALELKYLQRIAFKPPPSPR